MIRRCLSRALGAMFLFCSVASAQFLLMPARQVSVDNSTWVNFNAADSNTLQSVLDWADANWGLMDADTLDGQHGDYYTLYSDTAASNALSNATAIATSNLWALLHASNVQVDVSGFTRIPQTETNVQKVLDWADSRFGRIVFSSYSQTNYVPFTSGTQTRVDNYQYGVVTTNVGGAFNPTSGIFVCQIPGWYMFTAHGRVVESGPWLDGIHMGLSSSNFISLPPAGGMGDLNYPYTSVGCGFGGSPGASTTLMKYMDVGHSMAVWLNTNVSDTNVIPLHWQAFQFAGFYLGPE